MHELPRLPSQTNDAADDKVCRLMDWDIGGLSQLNSLDHLVGAGEPDQEKRT